MLGAFKPFPRHLRVPFLLAYLCCCIQLLAVLVAFVSLQPVVPLFYSLALPTQQLVAKEWLFIVPGIGCGIALAHTGLVSYERTLDVTLLQIFSWMTAVLELVLTLGLLRIVWIVS